MSNIGRKTQEITALIGAADAIEDVLAHAKVGEALTEPARRHALRALRALSAVEALWVVDAEGLEGAPREVAQSNAVVEPALSARADPAEAVPALAGGEHEFQAAPRTVEPPANRAANGTSTPADAVHLAMDERAGLRASLLDRARPFAKAVEERVQELAADGRAHDEQVKRGPPPAPRCADCRQTVPVRWRTTDMLFLCDACTEKRGPATPDSQGGAEITKVCAWRLSPECLRHISGPPQGPDVTLVSHGMCASCFAIQSARDAAERAGKGPSVPA